MSQRRSASGSSQLVVHTGHSQSPRQHFLADQVLTACNLISDPASSQRNQRWPR